MATGHIAGIECPQCKQGKLEVVMRSSSAGVSSTGVVGIRMYNEVIDHLACSSCFLMYLAVDRGCTLESIMRRQLTGFKNPPEKPSVCSACTKALSTETSREFGGSVRKPQYLFCDPCQKIFWVFTWEEQNPDMKDLVDKIKLGPPL